MRILELIKKELELDKLKLEETLETTLNEKLPIDEKTIKIKKILEQMGLNDLSLLKFNYYLGEKPKIEEKQQ